MIQDKTIDEALIEIMRTKRALESLRAHRKERAGGAYPEQLFDLLMLTVVEQAACIERLQATLVEAISKSPMRVKL